LHLSSRSFLAGAFLREAYADPVMGENRQPQIAVVGPGAVGCLFASFFSRAGHAVSLLDKRPERARTLSEQGVSLLETDGASQRFMIPVFTEPETGPCDVLFICVKAFDTLAAVQHALALVDRDTTVVSLQNGLGNLETLAANITPGQVVCAVTGHGATMLAPGSVRHAGSGITRVAPFAAQGMQRAALVEKLLASAGLDIECLPDVESVRWSKLVVNAAVNPLSAIHDVPNGRLVQDMELGQRMRQAADEGQRVAVARGVDLLYSNAGDEAERVCRDTGENLSSMLQDVRRKKRTEIDAINGAIVASAVGLGIPAPVNTNLVEQIHRIEQSRWTQVSGERSDII